MSIDQTPAMDRAAEALVNEPLPRENDGSFSPERYATNLARAVVSAALHDPDEGRDPMAEVLCLHDESMYHLERTDDFPCSACVRAADAVRAAILGEAS